MSEEERSGEAIMYVSRFENLWNEQQGSILHELCDNLFVCTLSDNGNSDRVQRLKQTVLADLCENLKKCYGNSYGFLERFPLALLAMRLYTQQDVDIDRSLLFLDCPRTGVPGQREKRYAAYRRKVKASRNS